MHLKNSTLKRKVPELGIYCDLHMYSSSRKGLPSQSKPLCHKLLFDKFFNHPLSEHISATNIFKMPIKTKHHKVSMLLSGAVVSCSRWYLA